jgi:hypothetical protein
MIRKRTFSIGFSLRHSYVLFHILIPLYMMCHNLPLDMFSNNRIYIKVQKEKIGFIKMKIKYFLYIYKTFIMSLLCSYFVSFSASFISLSLIIIIFFSFTICGLVYSCFFHSITHLFRSSLSYHPLRIIRLFYHVYTFGV